MGKKSNRRLQSPEYRDSPQVSSAPPAGRWFERGWRADFLICIALALATAAVYSPSLRAGFVNMDDYTYVVHHVQVHTAPTLDAIAYAFQAGKIGTWQPLVFISFMIDWVLYGLNPMGYHLTNVLLHILTAILLYFTLRWMTGSAWRSALVAALFALHPLHVESVAWVSERKDTLSGLFWVLTMLAYVYYANGDKTSPLFGRPSGVTRKQERKMYASGGLPTWCRYALLLITYTIGLLAKSMLVTLPVVLLMLDVWPLERYARAIRDGQPRRKWDLIFDKLPLLIPAVVCGAITSTFQQTEHATQSLQIAPLVVRLENALVACVSYIGDMIWPAKIGAHYPHAFKLLPTLPVAGSFILLVGISLLVWKSGRSYLRVGWLWYLVTLVPVIGLVQVGLQSRADRYTYIPLIGLFMMIAWSIPTSKKPVGDPLVVQIGSRRTTAYLWPLASVVCLGALMPCTYKQVGYWHDSVTLWEHTLTVSKEDYTVRMNLGTALGAQGKFSEALQQFQRAMLLKTENAPAHYDAAIAYVKLHKYEDSTKEFRAMMNAATPTEMVQFSGFQVLADEGISDQTMKKYSVSLNFESDPAKDHADAGYERLKAGDEEGAMMHYKAALRINPESADACFLYGQVLLHREQPVAAYTQFAKVVKLNPAYKLAYQFLAMLDYNAGRYADAWRDVHLCEKYGGVLAPDSISLLSSKMPEPKE